MRQCQQLYARGNVLLRKFHMCSMDVKVKLFNTYCSPMYTARLWRNHTAYSFQRLNVCLYILRPRYCSASGLFAACGIPNIIQNLIYKGITRLNESTNGVIFNKI